MAVQKKNPPLTDRQSKILLMVEESGYATLEGLSEKYGLSMQTVRRDIIALSDAGRLQRFHGGAGPIEREEATRLDYKSKQDISRPEKMAIGKSAAALIHDGATLFLDVGTTMEACASVLSRKKGFTIFTNSMPAALKFDPQDHQVFVLGGKMAGRDGSIVGMEALNLIRDVSLDYALIACSTIDQDGRVMDFDLDKIAIKKAAMNAAQKSLLLATQSKFGRPGLAVIARTEQFDAVVTHEQAPA